MSQTDVPTQISMSSGLRKWLTSGLWALTMMQGCMTVVCPSSSQNILINATQLCPAPPPTILTTSKLNTTQTPENQPKNICLRSSLESTHQNHINPMLPLILGILFIPVLILNLPTWPLRQLLVKSKQTGFSSWYSASTLTRSASPYAITEMLRAHGKLQVIVCWQWVNLKNVYEYGC